MCPKNPDKTVMMVNEIAAAENTSRRAWRIAIRAAIKKVLSPISDRPIMATAMAKDPKCEAGISFVVLVVVVVVALTYGRSANAAIIVVICVDVLNNSL